MSLTVPLYGFGGGGESLNFKVVGDTTEPTNPNENTIWVNTDKKIASWIFSATQPKTATEGMVWITTGVTRTVEFNALKKNGIQVCPISAKQYVSGEWKDVTAMSYQGGKWVELVRIYQLYKNGVLHEDLVGKWKTVVVDGLTVAPTATENADNITIKPKTDGISGGIAYWDKKIDISAFNSLVFDGKIRCSWDWASIGIWTSIGSERDENLVAVFTASGPTGTGAALVLDGKATIDISGISSGEYYIGFYIRGTSNAHIIIRELYLE